MTNFEMHLSVTTAAALLALCFASGGACSASGDDGGGPGSGASSSSGTAAGGAGGIGGGFGNNGGSSSSSGNGGDCAEVSEAAENKIQPADIILAIDQSGSMDLETSWVTNQLNGFATQITQSGIDVHVVVIAGKPGSENGFCIPAPLGSGNCPADDNPPIFKHVDQHVDSSDALLQILGRYDDYKDMLRPDAAKHVIVISDDDSSLGSAAFDTQLKALDPPLFDDYVFHAIVSDDDDPGTFDCIISPQPCCGVSADEGKVYKQLISMTGGVFGDLCQQNFQPVWNQVSTQVATNATLACEWDIPEPPEGEVFDPDLVNVEFTVEGGSPQSLGQVPSEAECSQYSGGWYYDDPVNPTKILVCPDTCAAIQSADNATISIKFGCNTVPATPR
ncbi:MAG: VWA domain-containing protein [Deltaproteobacteria bacterium]|nr:VWA domain-containing protein [Deltaproteobacteria bacterium]